eukprot:1163522-Amphidinium_carterae.1
MHNRFSRATNKINQADPPTTTTMSHLQRKRKHDQRAYKSVLLLGDAVVYDLPSVAYDLLIVPYDLPKNGDS